MTERASKPISVYLEVGSKRTFAGALDWPGWCRAGRDDAAAVRALADYSPRYAAVLRSAGIEFVEAEGETDLRIAERLVGNATTDFGAPGVAPSSDDRPVDDAELERLRTILGACWAAFDRAVARASGGELRTGPRGGGRHLVAVLGHVCDAEAGYLSRLASKAPEADSTDALVDLAPTRVAVLQALEAAARGLVPAEGPRGGRRWSGRYFARRVAWHALDHAWEIEDRSGA